MAQFNKKWVLITGASSGIGKAFARRLASEGANLVLVARNEDALQNLAALLKQQHAIETLVIPKDLARLEAPQELFDAIERAGLSIDVLINNAGFGVYGKLHETPLDSNQHMLLLNIIALSSLTQLFLPNMLGKKAGIVINIASIAGFFPYPYLSNYAASKAFVKSFTEALWSEYRADGIQFLTVCPGSTDTNFFNVAHMKPSQPKPDKPEWVVEQTLKALNKNKIYVTCGTLGNVIIVQLLRIFTSKFILKMIEGRRNNCEKIKE